ncbi:MAG TPA: response regulator [Gammaproteobacteria bacterium]|nr:response regulator [Gammaproteobacteria bacterium]
MKATVVENPKAQAAGRPVIGVVDADIAMGEALQSLLRSHGYEVLCQTSAEEALADLSRFDLLIVGEEKLPGMSGIELIEKMRGRGTPLPSIVLTSPGNIPLTVRAIRAGAADCLEKPFFKVVLLGRIKQILSNPTA